MTLEQLPLDQYTTDGSVICPWCEHHDNTGGGYDPMSVPWVEDDVREFKCGNCGKRFKVEANISVSHEMKAFIVPY